MNRRVTTRSEHTVDDLGTLVARVRESRVILVFRREGSDWRLVHRHADALVQPIGMEPVALLAHGSFARLGRPARPKSPRPVARQPRTAESNGEAALRAVYPRRRRFRRRNGIFHVSEPSRPHFSAVASRFRPPISPLFR